MDENRDLQDVAKSATEDFYELIGIDILADESEIKRQYRKSTVKYHPDKNPDDKNAAEKFITLGIARDILLDPTLRAIYDGARQRRQQAELEKERRGGKRQKDVDDLEKREREGLERLQRKRQEEREQEQKVSELAELGKRKMEEHAERVQKERQDDELRAQMDRSVKVRFRREGEAATWDKDIMISMFERYGEVDTVIMGSDKKTKVAGEKHRRVEATVTVVYFRYDSAQAAVASGKSDYPFLESVSWASKESEMKSDLQGKWGAPSTPAAQQGKTFKATYGIGRGLNAAPGRPKFANLQELEEFTLKRCKEVDEKRSHARMQEQKAA